MATRIRINTILRLTTTTTKTIKSIRKTRRTKRTRRRSISITSGHSHLSQVMTGIMEELEGIMVEAFLMVLIQIQEFGTIHHQITTRIQLSLAELLILRGQSGILILMSVQTSLIGLTIATLIEKMSQTLHGQKLQKKSTASQMINQMNLGKRLKTVRRANNKRED
jgi:hypothetical protein